MDPPLASTRKLTRKAILVGLSELLSVLSDLMVILCTDRGSGIIIMIKQ